MPELPGRLDANNNDGGTLTVRLLDRVPVLADMTGCERFKTKDEKA